MSRYTESLGELAMRRRSEQAMRAAKSESELASRTKSAFLATVSHELRTPLNSIIGFSDVIRAQKDPNTAEYAEHIAKSGRRLLEVVNDILDISKIESGTFALNRQPAYPDEVIEAAAEAMRDAIDARKQMLDLRVPRDLPMLSIDSKRIKQLVVNLLSNANKFTPEGGRILVVARKNPDGGVSIAIADTGVGMTEDQIKTALVPFGQVQGHLSRTEEGAGLGLPIARGLARQHGGDLFIESKPGQGTTVILTLPPDQECQQ